MAGKLVKERPLRKYKWEIIIICVVVAAAVLLMLFTDILEALPDTLLLYLVSFLISAIILIAVIAILSKVIKILQILTEIGPKLEQVNDVLERSRSELVQINRNSRLSETAKAIAFRDAERQSLREVVYDKLSQQDFATTLEIIDEIAHRSEYNDLAESLRAEAVRYRDATDQERINQVINHIEKLLENFKWAKASAQIEALIKAAPDSEQAKAMRQRLIDKKEDRKKELLTEWDQAVTRQETDRSLEILKELDLYLTPNEGLALQEAARDVFRNKLHNLGVQFSLAISGREWNTALNTAEQIMEDFPNSRMAEEIHERIEALREKAQ